MAKKKKDCKVGGLTVKRDGNSYKASWKVPSDLKKNASYLDVDSKRDRADASDSWGSEHAKLSTSKTGESLKFTRSDYYPCRDSKGNARKKLKSIAVRVRAKKKSGSGYYGWESDTYAFEKPKKPSVSLSVNDTFDTLTATVKADEGSGKAERYDSVVNFEYRGCVGGRSWGWKSLVSDYASRSTEFAKGSGDLSGEGKKKVNALGDSDWVEVRVNAWSRGLRGKSDATGYKTHMFAQPAKPTLGAPTVTNNQVLVPVTIKGTTVGSKSGGYSNGHPVDTVQLYRYVGTSMAASLGDWAQVEGATDDGSCVGLHDMRANAEPTETGEHVWYRVVATHDGYSVASEPVEAAALYKKADTSKGSVATVDSVADNGDGESVTAKVSWQKSSTAAYDTTVISWSDDQDAWQSTDDPDSFEMDDVTWDDDGDLSLTVKVKGLDDGTPYWFRARRTSSANDQKGAWSAAVRCDVSSTPSAPTLTAPTTVERGRGFAVSWSAGGTQTAWRLLLMNAEGASDGAVLASGTGGATSATVADGDARLSALDYARLAVEVSTGGDYARSASVDVAIADAPTAAVTCEQAITASGHAVTVAVTPTGAEFALSMTAEGSCSGWLPDGSGEQAAGDVVWSERGLTGGEDGTVTLTVPDAAKLVDGARYRIAVTPTCAGLTGEAAEPSFAYTATDSDGNETVGETHALEVAWAHQAAAAPSCAVTVDVDTRSATITPQKPADALDGDTWSLYRDTPDGFALVAEGLAFGGSALDPWAPYAADGACSYRVATVTADGDCDYADFAFEHACKAVRVDWEGGSVELPYNIDLSESYGKSFEGRSFLDRAAQGGTWGASVSRTCSLSCTVIDGEVAEAVRDLARHAGSCFVRFPDGCAYEADVQVGGIEQSATSGYVRVSMDITEVELASYVGRTA